VPFASKCGSTSVACCPGKTVYGSELTGVRFAPTGFWGGVTEEDGEEEPEQPTSTIVNNTNQQNGIALWQKRSPIFLVTDSFCPLGLEYVGIKNRRVSSSAALSRISTKLDSLAVTGNPTSRQLGLLLATEPTGTLSCA
jgi:hypothetical protein